MQPGMQSAPASRAMMMDYIHLTDACDRQAGEEVLLVLNRLLGDCWEHNKVRKHRP